MYKQGNELERVSEIFISKLTKRLGFPVRNIYQTIDL